MWTLLGDNNFCCYLKVDRNMEANTKYSTCQRYILPVSCSQRVTSSNIHFQLAGNVHRFVTVPQSILSINIFPTSWPILMTFFAQIEATIHSSNSGRITLGCCNFWWNKLKSYHLTPPSILCALLNRCTIVPPWLMMLMLIKLKFT